MNKKIEILVLDDEEGILGSLRRTFMDEPYAIATTSNYQEALTILDKENIKVVLSDYRMPQIAGTEFLKKVKQQHPRVMRILFTGYADFSAAEEAINVGEVYRFIGKPWDSDELRATVNNAREHFSLIEHNQELLEITQKNNEDLKKANETIKSMYEVQKEFTSTVSHELRTPLASIKIAIDLVVKKMIGELNPEQEDVLIRAKRNVDRLKRLIDDILDLTKIEAGKLQMNFMMNNINGVIREVMEAQKDVAKSKNLYLEAMLATDLPKIPFDNDRIIQVLNNLLSNALKFTHTGGIIITSSNHGPDDSIVIAIRDTGKGIKEKDIPKLFEKFQQIESPEHNEVGGTGLGLAICKEIIKRHNGKIWVESTPEKGTTFYFNLPREAKK